MPHGMRPFGDLLSKEDALARLLAAAPVVARVEELPLAAARGRACAEDVRAPFPVPPFARATMDGYAVRAGEAGPLRVVGDVPAGARDLPTVGPGGCARIATGAPLPPGADAVVRVEDAREDAGGVAVKPARPGQFVDPAGSDLAEGAPVASRGEVLTPARLGLLASVGRTAVRALARPRVAVVTTGDELLQPGEPHDPRRVFDANGTTLRALLEEAGAAVVSVAHARDDLAATRAALDADADLVVVSGGASVGARDLVADALDEVLLHGVRVKPGKPLLAGRRGGRLVIGLPGNPTSALSNAALFVAPVVRRMAGLPEAAPNVVEAALASDVRGEPDRFLFLPVRLEDGRAHPTFKGSGALTSLAASDGWVGVPEGASLRAGDRVAVTRW